MVASTGPGANEDIGHTGYSTLDAVAAAPSVRVVGPPAGLNGSAALLLEHVTRYETVTLGELADVLVEHYGLAREDALVDVAVFVHDGQMAGALSYHAAVRAQLKGHAHLLLDLLMLPVRGWIVPPSIRRRYYPYSVARMVLDSARAQLLIGLVVVALVAVPLSFIDGFWSGFGATLFTGFATGMVGGLVVLGVLHEGGHAAACTGWGSRPVAIYRQGLRIGLQRARLTPLRDLLVSVAGPLTGAAVGTVLLAVLLAVDRTAPATHTRGVMIGVLFATSIQVACLVPPAVDGNVVVASWRRHRQARHEARGGTR